MTTRLLPLVLLLSACAPPVRFADRPILWRDPDDTPIPVPPKHGAGVYWMGARDALFQPADRVLAIDRGGESENVNALDEVPDSSWFLDPRRDRGLPDDRTRLLPIDPERMARGACDDHPPPEPPLTVTNGKLIGASPGFSVVDARGQRWLIKVDPERHVGLVTSTEVVASRLAWASGWLVPGEQLYDLRADELRLDPNAWMKDQIGREVPFTRADLDRLLARPGRRADGRIAALASRWIEGDLVGTFSYLGRNKRDANDRIPHEDRRDLRGFGVWASWVNDIDTVENNTLDSYVGEPGKGHLVHYQQDVGGAFGTFAARPMSTWMGEETAFATGRIFASFASLGAIRRPWEGEVKQRERDKVVSKWPELGYFEAEGFDPRRWQPLLPNPAFVRQTARDRYWGAKRVAAFNADELRAAVATGRYRPEAAEYVFDVLWKRRDRIARAFMGDVAALEHIRFQGGRLCFDDAWLDAGLGGVGATEYAARDESGAWLPVAADRCLPPIPRGDYRILELGVRRPGMRRFTTLKVHTRGDRILGLER